MPNLITVVEGLWLKKALQVLPTGPQSTIVPIIEVNKARNPWTLTSQALAVPTSATAIFKATVPGEIELHSILIIPSTNSLVNGVTFWINYGQYSFGDAVSPSGAITPFAIGFDKGDYPILNAGDALVLYGGATTTGSSLQIIFIGVYR